jgi:hypothetical protein
MASRVPDGVIVPCRRQLEPRHRPIKPERTALGIWHCDWASVWAVTLRGERASQARRLRRRQHEPDIHICRSSRCALRRICGAWSVQRDCTSGLFGTQNIPPGSVWSGGGHFDRSEGSCPDFRRCTSGHDETNNSLAYALARFLRWVCCICLAFGRFGRCPYRECGGIAQVRV